MISLFRKGLSRNTCFHVWRWILIEYIAENIFSHYTHKGYQAGMLTWILFYLQVPPLSPLQILTILQWHCPCQPRVGKYFLVCQPSALLWNSVCKFKLWLYWTKQQFNSSAKQQNRIELCFVSLTFYWQLANVHHPHHIPHYYYWTRVYDKGQQNTSSWQILKLNALQNYTLNW